MPTQIDMQPHGQRMRKESKCERKLLWRRCGSGKHIHHQNKKVDPSTNFGVAFGRRCSSKMKGRKRRQWQYQIYGGISPMQSSHHARRAAAAASGQRTKAAATSSSSYSSSETDGTSPSIIACSRTTSFCIYPLMKSLLSSQPLLCVTESRYFCNSLHHIDFLVFPRPQLNGHRLPWHIFLILPPYPRSPLHVFITRTLQLSIQRIHIEYHEP